MNSFIRAASRLAARPLLDRVLANPVSTNNTFTIAKRWAHNQPLTYDFVRERILLTLRLFDKVDPEKVTLDSHFVNDLGLDSLDHVEIIMHLEDEFYFEIPDKDAEKLITPRHMLQYITDKEEAYEELQKLSAEHHHGDDGHGHADTGHDHGETQNSVSGGGSHKPHDPNITQIRKFSGINDNKTSEGGGEFRYRTTFHERPIDPPNFEAIQARVMKVCSNYDKIDSSKLDAASHFVDDLGLDSLDHVEILMEIEDEFGLEIPDKESDKMMRPAQIAKYVFKVEEERGCRPEERPF